MMLTMSRRSLIVLALSVVAAAAVWVTQSPGGPISVSLSGTDEAELRGYFERLSDGGTVVLPLEKAPWGDSFGMCRDRFGVTWMVNIGRSPT